MANGCGDVLSIEDLRIGKLHNVFEAEVITGKAGGVSYGENIDYATNPVTGQVQKTLPAVLRDAGYTPADFDFVTGGTLAEGQRSHAVLWPLSAGGDGDYYYWEGDLPKTIPANSTPESTGGVAKGSWRPVGDLTLRTDITSTGSGKGADMIPLPQGGTVRDALQYVTPEMFGAVGDGSGDDSDAIIAACTYARQTGLNRVIGDGKYRISKGIPCISGVQKLDGFSDLLGFELDLHTVVVSDEWPSLPNKWWTATPAFYSAGNQDGGDASCENFKLTVHEFNGKFKAHFCQSQKGGFSTATIYCGISRNHIIGYKCIGDINMQSASNEIMGDFWQTGYVGAVVGGTLDGTGRGQTEAHSFSIKWLATQRYGGIILCDGARYASIRKGTYDFNGAYSSVLTLTGLSTGDTPVGETANRYIFEFGKDIMSSDGSVVGTSLGQLMWTNNAWNLHVTEDESKTDGISKWDGLQIKNADGSFTATVSKATVCSTSSATYFDIMMSQRLAGFARCKIDTEYTGGFWCHYEFTNNIWTPHTQMNRRGFSLMGLGVTSTYNHLYLYANQLSNAAAPWADISENGVTFNKPVTLNTQKFTGNEFTASLVAGVPKLMMTFIAADAESRRRHHVIYVTSTVSSMCGTIEVIVGVSGISVIKNVSTADITITVDGLKMYFNNIGADSITRINAVRV